MEIDAAQIKTSLKKWPDELYAQAFPGTLHNFVQKGGLAKFQKIALNATKEKAAKLSVESKEGYDWVYALIWSEEHLLSKPFETWTVDDLCQLNACMTRLTDRTKGQYRTGIAYWPIDLNPTDQARMKSVEFACRRNIPLPQSY